MRRQPLPSGRWEVTARRVRQDNGPLLTMIVRLHLIGPSRIVRACSGLTFAPMPDDLDRSDAWWGAFAAAAAFTLEAAIREGRLDMLPTDGELTIVRVDCPPEDAVGSELPDDGGPDRTVHRFDIDSAASR